MGKYLIEFSYTREGAKGLLAEGGTKRREAVEKAIKGAGGRLEAFYYAFGEDDGLVIADGLDNVSVAAVTLAVAASGAAGVKTTVLLTPEEIDQAVKKTNSYRPPGG